MVAHEQTITVLACYTDDPTDGVYALHNGTNKFGVAVETIAPVQGVVTQVDMPVHPGRTLLKLVNTTNHTYAKGAFGHVRPEWYPSLLSTDLVGRRSNADYEAQVHALASPSMRQ